MTNEIHQAQYITPIGIEFMAEIVPDLAKKAFSPYKGHEYFMVSHSENSYACAGIALTLAAIEAHRNRIHYHEEKKAIGNVISDIVEMFAKSPHFPSQKFESIIGEVFTIRNVILHSHIYELNVSYRQSDGKVAKFEAKRLADYGDKFKLFRKSVNLQTSKTHLLGMNVQPLKIGFEELFIVLLVVDLFAGLVYKAFDKHYVTYQLLHQLDDHYIENLSELLTYYYDRVPSGDFVNRVDRLSEDMRTSFGDFIPQQGDYFVTNICPRYRALGFHKRKAFYHCRSCNQRQPLLKAD